MMINLKNKMDTSLGKRCIETLLYNELMKFKGIEGAIFRWPINLYSVGYSARKNKKHHSIKGVMINVVRGFCRRYYPDWWV